MSDQELYDVIVVGAGPAGLNAALVLGRCKRRVLLFDDAKPRNWASHAMHGFLSRDGTPPSELLAIAQQQLRPYPSVQIEHIRVTDAACTKTGFTVTTSDGRIFQTHKLLLASGVIDEIPVQSGFFELYGTGVFLCPYCDGWEMRDKPIAVYGRGDDKGAGMALEMTLWSSDIVLCTDGPSLLTDQCRQRLNRQNIAVREEKIGSLDILSKELYNASFDIVFDSGQRLRRTGLFFNTGRHQSTDLAKRLGCETYTTEGSSIKNKEQMTNVNGLYIAGDASKDVLQVIVAAAEGAKAAIGINIALLKEDLG